MVFFHLASATFVHEHPAPCNPRIPYSAIHRAFATAFMAIPTALAITSNVCTTPRGLNLSLAWHKHHGTHPLSRGISFTIILHIHFFILVCDAGLAALFIPLGFLGHDLIHLFLMSFQFPFVTSIFGTRCRLVRYEDMHFASLLKPGFARRLCCKR